MQVKSGHRGLIIFLFKDTRKGCPWGNLAKGISHLQLQALSNPNFKMPLDACSPSSSQNVPTLVTRPEVISSHFPSWKVSSGVLPSASPFPSHKAHIREGLTVSLGQHNLYAPSGETPSGQPYPREWRTFLLWKAGMLGAVPSKPCVAAKEWAQRAGTWFRKEVNPWVRLIWLEAPCSTWKGVQIMGAWNRQTDSQTD